MTGFFYGAQVVSLIVRMLLLDAAASLARLRAGLFQRPWQSAYVRRDPQGQGSEGSGFQFRWS